LNIRRDHSQKKRGITVYAAAIFLLSIIIFNLNPTLPVIYADKDRNSYDQKVKNKSLIGDISDNVISLGNIKNALKQVLQQIQTQIALTSGQDKATKAINQINSIIALNPNGPLSQSLLSLAKQEAAGNTDAVIKAAVRIAGKVSSGGDDLGQPLAAAQQAGTSSASSPLSILPQRTQTSSQLQQKAPQSIVDKPPVANAGHPGPDQNVNESSLVTLDGSASYDPDGNPMTYSWTQTAGPSVKLSNPTSAITTFTAPPPVSTNTAELTFQLTVKNTAGLTDSDSVHITVNHVTVLQSNGITQGAMTDESGNEDGNAHLVNAFNNLAGKKIGVAFFSDNWFDGIHFPLDECISIRTTGAVPFIRIQNWIRYGSALSDAGPYTHKNIIAGMFDSELRAYAQAAKSFGTTLIIEYGVEVNGNWFPWSQEGPEPYKAAYRHIVNLFREQGVTNVRWAFHVDATDNNNGYKWYPGDDIIDWIGTSCYGDESKKGCIGTLQNIYNSFASISTTKPLGIFEWGIGDAIDTANTLHIVATDSTYSRIKLLMIWNEHIKGEPDRRINVNPENLQAYRTGIANQVYVSTYHD
jgi:Glycosyl hydrolase family 26